MRLLVCGSRDWTDQAFIDQTLDAYHAEHPVTVVIEGEAAGADVMARSWGLRRGVTVRRFPADWARYGKAAGPIRNQQMLDEGRPDAAIAFTYNLATSRGTRDMVDRARSAGLPVLVFP